MTVLLSALAPLREMFRNSVVDLPRCLRGEFIYPRREFHLIQVDSEVHGQIGFRTRSSSLAFPILLAMNKATVLLESV
jgi:hypothetical protein